MENGGCWRCAKFSTRSGRSKLIATAQVVKPSGARRRCIAISSGMLRMQGVQVVAQKLTSTTCPRRLESGRRSPSSDWNVTSGAGGFDGLTIATDTAAVRMAASASSSGQRARPAAGRER